MTNTTIALTSKARGKPKVPVCLQKSDGRKKKQITSSMGYHTQYFDYDEADAESEKYILPFGFSFAPVFANVVKMLMERPHSFELGYDEFSKRIYCRGKEFTDSDLREITEWVQRRKCTAPLSIVHDAIKAAADRNKFHQVRDYLSELVWDGTRRLDTLLIDNAGCSDTDLTRAISRKWMIQAVARIYRPGCQADATLILESPQGFGKSSFLRALFGAQWFSDYLPDLHKTDAMLQLRGVWLIELAELSTLARSEAASIKRFLTSRSDRFRAPYERTTTDTPRSCVFAGSVNPGASGYLKDETGGRRFWPIVVNQPIDVQAIFAIRDQLWAEALVAFNHGEKWYFTEEPLLRELSAQQEERYVGDPWQEKIEEYILEHHWVTIPEILQAALKIENPGKWNPGDQMRVARCLAVLGWQRYQARTPTGRESRYRERGTPLPNQKLRTTINDHGIEIFVLPDSKLHKSHGYKVRPGDTDLKDYKARQHDVDCEKQKRKKKEGRKTAKLTS